MLARLVSVELVDKCLRAMKLGKAAGVDNIETEHLRYAHPDWLFYCRFYPTAWWYMEEYQQCLALV